MKSRTPGAGTRWDAEEMEVQYDEFGTRGRICPVGGSEAGARLLAGGIPPRIALQAQGSGADD